MQFNYLHRKLIIYLYLRVPIKLSASFQSKAARPKPVYLWSVADVVKWLRRHCSEECGAYADYFVQHEITGLALVRVNENILRRLGVDNQAHRQEILRQIMKLRLKTDIMEIMDLSRDAKPWEQCEPSLLSRLSVKKEMFPYIMYLPIKIY